MSDSDVSSVYMTSYVDISSNDEEDFNSEADVGEEVQQVNQPIGNDQNQERPEARGQPANQPQQGNVMPREAQRYMGLIICKEYNGTRYPGTVVDYDVQRKWFRVEYEDEEFEDMDRESVIKYLAKKSQICSKPAGMKNRGSGSRKKNAGKKKKKKGASTSSRPKRRRTDEGPYVPLAYRETKKDDYIYY